MTAWSAAHPKQMTVHTATIEDIQLNKLTKHDLEVEFPAEAQVSDRRFQVGPDGQRIPNSEGAKVLARLRQPLEKMVGQPAPELPKDGWVGGERPDLTGQPYLLHFWATWCGPCKRDLPVVKWLAEEGAHIVGVHPGGTPADEVARFVDQLELNYSTFVDSSDGDERPRILAGFPSGVFPYCVLVDAQGNVAAHGFLREVVGEFRSLRDAK